MIWGMRVCFFVCLFELLVLFSSWLRLLGGDTEEEKM